VAPATERQRRQHDPLHFSVGRSGNISCLLNLYLHSPTDMYICSEFCVVRHFYIDAEKHKK
jgi:hypothetical protein